VTARPMLDHAHPDRALVVALQAGDEGAFRTMVARHHASMVRVAMGHVPSRAVAEEVTQDTWLAVIKGLPTFEGRSSLKTWIFTILVNQARTRGQREHRSTPFSSVGGDDGDDGPTVDPDRFLRDGQWAGHWSQPPTRFDTTSDRLEDDETRAVVEQTIAALPANQQRVVWLRDVEGWTAAEVCEALELSEANQRVLLHRGRAKVRAALERHLA